MFLMCFYMEGVIGIEPMLTESKSDVLPLHNTPTIINLIF